MHTIVCKLPRSEWSPRGQERDPTQHLIQGIVRGEAAMAGIILVAAIGAPSTLAVELAVEFNITLLGFLKENRFNVYNSCDRVVITDII